MFIKIVEPYGYCFGVENALKIAYKAKEENPSSKIYILGDLVHNEQVVEKLQKDGFYLLSEKKGRLETQLLTVPVESVLVFSAHGHSPFLDKIAQEREMKIYDATCIFVKKNEKDILQEIKKGNEIIYIGIRNHAEANAALGIDQEKIHLMVPYEAFEYSKVLTHSPFVVSQTTMTTQDILSCVKQIKEHFPNARFAAKQCFSTEERQKNTLLEGKGADGFVVLGGRNSNNTAKLSQLIKEHFPNKFCVQIAYSQELLNYEKELQHCNKILIVSGASTPKTEIDKTYNYILKTFDKTVI